jgi:hypothetical protein
MYQVSSSCQTWGSCQACIRPDVSGTSARTGLPGCFVQVRIPSLLVAMLWALRERIPDAGVLVIEL